MFEKVNPAHPDKIADRIAGAIVDEAYRLQEDPKIAVEVLIGHGQAKIIAETSVRISPATIDAIVQRIAGVPIKVDVLQVSQDVHLAKNQADGFRCGDNGIFRGCPLSEEQKELTETAREIWEKCKSDGKYIADGKKKIVCQSGIEKWEDAGEGVIVNPLGAWTGGLDVDTGAVNRKLGSDIGDAVTGGGLHGKDLSKADVSVNIYLHLLANKMGFPVCASCAIGDEEISVYNDYGTKTGVKVKYEEVVRFAREYISKIGGFEKFAEWGLIR